MYFTKIRISGGVTPVDLPIVGASLSDTYVFKAGDGLGPTDIAVSIMNGVYQGRWSQPRQVVLRVGLNPNYAISQTAEQLRTQLYSCLTPPYGQALKVQVMNAAAVVAQAEGYVSKIEIVPFSKDPEVQLTIDCVDAYLAAPAPTVLVPVDALNFDIPYVGTAPAGFEMQVTFTASTGLFYIARQSDANQVMYFDYDFITGDILTINTIEGERSITLSRDDGTRVDTPLVGYMSDWSIWLDLKTGTNSFTLNTTNFDWDSFTFTPLYWGV